jgi:predicted ABC-type ATPase
LLRDAFGVNEFVNADVLSAGLSAYNPKAVDFQAGRLMVRRLGELAGERRSFGFETTLASRSYAAWLKTLAAGGYIVSVLYVWVGSPELAVQRVRQRVREGGHDVAEHVVRRRYYRGARNFFRLYMPLAEHWAVWDNSGNERPQQIAVKTGKEPAEIIVPERWSRFQKVAEWI